MMDGWELRQRRAMSGLTLREVARAAGTTVANVAAYERGDKTPRPRTLDRIVAMVDVGKESPIHRMSLLTVPAAAAAIRGDVRSGNRSTSSTLKFVREMVNNSKYVVGEPRERTAFFAEPSTTGDRRWDAMLAGVTESLALRHGFEPPEWTRGHAVKPWWFVSEAEALHAYAYAHSPMSLAVRGVFMDPASLESV
jgi:transcriptional regulator with XRE-family HTH domain